MSERDSRNLLRIYGRAATHVSPIAVRDLARPTGSPTSTEPFALFVGGTFYANVDGIRWFARHVAPRAPIETVVVGKGFEAYRDELEIEGKLRVVGAVRDLADWYERASFVVAPIFDGSGMKTKVAEALMFGKRVVGTPDAFAGYEDVPAEIGRVVGEADGFVSAMREGRSAPRHDDLARAVYEKRYSPRAQRERLAAILATPPAGPL